MSSLEEYISNTIYSFMRKAIDRILKDKVLHDELAFNSKKRVQKFFTKDKVAKQYIFYISL